MNTIDLSTLTIDTVYVLFNNPNVAFYLKRITPSKNESWPQDSLHEVHAMEHRGNTLHIEVDGFIMPVFNNFESKWHNWRLVAFIREPAHRDNPFTCITASDAAGSARRVDPPIVLSPPVIVATPRPLVLAHALTIAPQRGFRSN